MREALNNNPVAQIAVLGVLAVVVGFLLLSKMAGNSGGGDPSASSPTASDASTAPALADSAGTPAVPSPPAGTTPPATGEAPATPSMTGDAAVGEFEAGPGLPASVVKAYRDDKTVVLLVLRHGGIDDGKLRGNVERQRGRGELALFVTNAGHIARYSRITQGVDVDRVPALIVLRPRHLTHGVPKASLSYGFRGPESVDQAVSDALYKGPSNLPYYPR